VSAWRAANPGGTVDSLNVWAEDLPEFDAIGASWKVKAMSGQAPNAEESALAARAYAVANRFAAADKYLISVPMWNFSVPYKLKHYLDVIVQPGVTFGFDPAKGYFGLLPSVRPVQLVLSRGGTSYGPGEVMGALEFQESYLRGILGFMGLTNVSTLKVECTAFGPDVAEPIVAQVSEAARTAAIGF
jgi:FMN-dependent NADH-azoreductase